MDVWRRRRGSRRIIGGMVLWIGIGGIRRISLTLLRLYLLVVVVVVVVGFIFVRLGVLYDYIILVVQ